ncbi:hypothetical protein [Notoacmeibacter ruber]|uniref:Transmembrane protein n=1 Tax=Notoacmeibacter ruber TaxID=2670375 RepID=A0A3L7JDB3_9HYPH|nr:hypothetical protein [Notoacmeibacter ruber]RLQ88666.1 hypothetical protein D8780_11050 [Notoacmeibacter ruber]
MADIAAVLKKTIDGLPRHDSSIRAKVYDKARAQIRAKLLAAKPDADEATIDRNMAVVERAIRAVEDDYRFQDELGDVLGASDESYEDPALPPDPEPAADRDPPREEYVESPPVAPVTREMATSHEPPVEDAVFTETVRDDRQAHDDYSAPPADPHLADEAPELRPDPYEAEAPRADEPTSPLDEVTADTSESVSVAPVHDGADVDSHLTESTGEEDISRPEAAAASGYSRSVERKPRRWGAIIAALLILILAGGAGAVAYFMPDAVEEQLASIESGLNDFLGEEEATPTQNEAEAPSATGESDAGDAEEAQRPEKFTQRLAADGTETDPGPAGEPVDQFGEGTSVAPLTVAQNDAAQTPGDSGSDAQSPGAENGAEAGGDDAQPAVQVGQRAIYSEERTSNEQLRRLQGSVVWSKVEEQPGPQMDEEPALRADVYIPDTGTSMRMTLRRNGDPSLPASHVLELIFEPTTKEPGRSIREILRMMLKENEASPGEQLRAFPAEIGDNFFLMMLDEGQQARQANLNLIRDRDWFDLLVILEAGRRALFTLEKGLPGAKVVDEVLDYWQENPLQGQ